MMRRSLMQSFVTLLLVLTASGCSIVKTSAINMVGDALASGDSVYESEDDLDLVRDALPFGLKLIESLLAQSPKHPGLLLSACRGFVLYSFAYVNYPADVAMDADLDRARVLRARARKLYLRAVGYGLRGLERSYRGFSARLATDPHAAVTMTHAKKRNRDLPFLYWTAAALGLAISVSPDDATMLARLPEVEALLDRALELDEGWNHGALHEFEVAFAGARPGEPDYEAIKQHYKRARELSQGRSAGLYVAYAEAVSVPTQNAAEFRDMIDHALAVDPDADPNRRLVNLLAQRRARWLLGRIDDLILVEEPTEAARGIQ